MPSSFKVVLAAFFGGWEVMLIVGFALVLFSARRLPEILRSQRSEDWGQIAQKLRDDFILWLARGFDIGRIPITPGTFGSALGILWFIVLLGAGNFWVYLAGLVLGVALSIWLCGEAEKILKQTDPSSVVADEIAAMPLCFSGWVASHWWRAGTMPEPESFLTSHNWHKSLLVFVMFRVFDILKPWPVAQSQKLPGGWGVTVDDLLAALYVSGLSLLWAPRY